jgi:hypothetical protein
MKRANSQKKGSDIAVPEKRRDQPGFYLTGQVTVAYFKVRLVPQNFGCLASGHF